MEKGEEHEMRQGSAGSRPHTHTAPGKFIKLP